MRSFLPLVFAILTLVGVSCSRMSMKYNGADEPGWQDEIIYHVVQRSFYDSDGDHHGDLKGFSSKLEYLKELGVTAILFLPLYESDFYHNYFPVDYEKIDPEFGTMDDYFSFITAVHEHGLKFIMDMETQYAQEGHAWVDETIKDSASPLAGYIYIPSIKPDSKGYEFPVRLTGYDGFSGGIAMLNLNSPVLRIYMRDFYTYWVDPDKDGDFVDGVDGFRIDHIMDNLDNMDVFTNLYADFWKPIFEYCKTINPTLFIVGEQANWLEYGEDMLIKTGADASFGIPLRFAISGGQTIYMGGGVENAGRDELNPARIMETVEEMQKRIPPGKYYLNFIENHDMERWASAMGDHTGKIRCGAVLNILLPGIPSIYYGQELGIPGQVGAWGGDGNHIPVREAFPWTPGADDPGNAVFYKDTGPWWDVSVFNSGESEKIALSLQKEDPNSLWNFYRKLIILRKNNQVFYKGDYHSLPSEDEDILAFSRQLGADRAVVAMNLSENIKSIDLNNYSASEYKLVFGMDRYKVSGGILELDPWEFIVLMNDH
jgi:glycosidase